MNRLTMRSPIDDYVLIKNKSEYTSICFGCGRIGHCRKCFEEKALEKLAEYEDLEEQGLLLRLPCKVGDDIYFIPSKVNYKLNILDGIYWANKVYHQKVAQISISESKWWVIGDIDFEYGTGKIFMDDSYKKTWFLSKEEAEQALANMESWWNK